MATVLPSRRVFAAQAFELEMKRRRAIAAAALVVVLTQAVLGLSPFTTSLMNIGDAQGNMTRQVLILGTLAVQLLAPAGARPPMAVPTSILILLGYCLLSCAWAINPEIALRRLTLTAAVIVILVRAIGDLGAVRTLRVLRISLAVLLAINFLIVMVSPEGKHMALLVEEGSVIGDWRGIMDHKNAAGAACAFTVLLFTFDRGRMKAWLSALVVAGALVFLYKTQSKTSMGMLAIALLAGAAARHYNPRHSSVLVPLGLVCGTLLIGLAAMYSGVIEYVLDDPTAFTGRGAVWAPLLVYARENLWLGAGYQSFWQVGPASPIWTLTSGWVAGAISHGHNGYLDILVTLGLPGLLLTLAIVFVWPSIRLLCSVSIASGRRALFCAVMMFAAGHNLTESTLLDRIATVHVFLMAVVILIHRLSDQSEGAHHALRDRIVRLATREGLARARGRLAAGPRMARDAVGWRRDRRGAAAPGAEDPIA